jgi:hypothetical protein
MVELPLQGDSPTIVPRRMCLSAIDQIVLVTEEYGAVICLALEWVETDGRRLSKPPIGDSLCCRGRLLVLPHREEVLRNPPLQPSRSEQVAEAGLR